MPNSMKATRPFRSWIAALVTVLVGLLSVIRWAEGATPDAWAAHENQVVSACVKASHLRHAQAAGQVIEFDDSVGFSAVVIGGRYAQPHLKHQRGQVLCLFDKRTHTPYVSEADAIVRTNIP